MLHTNSHLFAKLCDLNWYEMNTAKIVVNVGNYCACTIRTCMCGCMCRCVGVGARVCGRMCRRVGVGVCVCVCLCMGSTFKFIFNEIMNLWKIKQKKIVTKEHHWRSIINLKVLKFQIIFFKFSIIYFTYECFQFATSP